MFVHVHFGGVKAIISSGYFRGVAWGLEQMHLGALDTVHTLGVRYMLGERLQCLERWRDGSRAWR